MRRGRIITRIAQIPSWKKGSIMHAFIAIWQWARNLSTSSSPNCHPLVPNIQILQPKFYLQSMFSLHFLLRPWIAIFLACFVSSWTSLVTTTTLWAGNNFTQGNLHIPPPLWLAPPPASCNSLNARRPILGHSGARTLGSTIRRGSALRPRYSSLFPTTANPPTKQQQLGERRYLRSSWSLDQEEGTISRAPALDFPPSSLQPPAH
jgi:hypothetical protein